MVLIYLCFYYFHHTPTPTPTHTHTPSPTRCAGRGPGPPPSEVSGSDGAPEGPAGGIRLPPALRSLLTEVAAALTNCSFSGQL